MKTANFIIGLFLLLSTSIFGQNTFTLSSKDLGGETTKKHEFNGFGCDGENQSPQLFWKNAPKETKSFAITMYDPDAPTGSGFWHWVVFDIPSNINELETSTGNPTTDLLPKGAIQSLTDYGIKGFGGPCPPVGHGYHQYIITVYALKTDKLGLDENATPAIVGFNLWANTLAKASIIAYYKR
ncbi:YbhB/YbcL family Raf kinase inhibitor-like protein [Myroides marinus]|uniref:YbhB/YbcL family Raf kinase inhibitor-like protein n=1 Tax=Myroides marinus TaxID=703342 RepID=UPI002574FE63|nr:YbhB/YbcL family Raf kinase inhibitor-like protein [Myroides marinus]MDM1363312.1 YbhB/YbcL family Raf kinase inhibitor-like protein [Myroides marinus]MDM1377362.1 YbhB/YbcL family Raf kinase inhibitor-like protein [Myroides marinus]